MTTTHLDMCPRPDCPVCDAERAAEALTTTMPALTDPEGTTTMRKSPTNHPDYAPDLTAMHGGSVVVPGTTPAPDPDQPRARRQRRVFMWSFLVIQGLYVLWIVTGLLTAHPSAGCTGQGVDPDLCTTAGQMGTAIGAGIVVVLWVLTDIVLGIGRWVVLTARKHRGAAHA